MIKKLMIGAITLGVFSACTGSETQSVDVASDSSASVAQAFVGQVTNVDSLAAFQIEGNQVKAYTCGGDDTFEAHTAWFSGEIGEDKKVRLTSADNRVIVGSFPDHKITAPPQGITAPPQGITAPPQGLLPNLSFFTLAEEPTADATVSGRGDMTFPDGKKVEWTVSKTTTKASGLYRFEDNEVVVGVIVHNDGRVFGAASSKETKKIIGQTKLMQPVGTERCLSVEVNGKTYAIEPLGESGACQKN